MVVIRRAVIKELIMNAEIAKKTAKAVKNKTKIDKG